MSAMVFGKVIKPKVVFGAMDMTGGIGQKTVIYSREFNPPCSNKPKNYPSEIKKQSRYSLTFPINCHSSTMTVFFGPGGLS